MNSIERAWRDILFDIYIKMGIKPTYISMKYLREELKKERKELKIKELRKRYKLEGVLE